MAEKTPAKPTAQTAKPTPRPVEGVTRLQKWPRPIDRADKAAGTGERHVPEADPAVPGVNRPA